MEKAIEQFQERLYHSVKLLYDEMIEALKARGHTFTHMLANDAVINPVLRAARLAPPSGFNLQTMRSWVRLTHSYRDYTITTCYDPVKRIYVSIVDLRVETKPGYPPYTVENRKRLVHGHRRIANRAFDTLMDRVEVAVDNSIKLEAKYKADCEITADNLKPK